MKTLEMSVRNSEKVDKEYQMRELSRNQSFTVKIIKWTILKFLWTFYTLDRKNMGHKGTGSNVTLQLQFIKSFETKFS